MNILLFSSSFPNKLEPLMGIFNYKLLENYPAEHNYKVVAPVPFGLEFKYRYHGGIHALDTVMIGNKQVEVYRPRYLLLPKRLLTPLIGFVEFLLSIKTIRRIHQKWHINLIHVNFAYPDGIAAMWISRVLKIKYVLTEHRGLLAETLDNFWLKSQLKKAYRSAAAVTTVSEYSASVLLKKTNVKATLIPNGLDFSRFQPQIGRERLQYLVCVANLIPTKGIQYLIEAISLLKLQGWSFTLDIIGEGSYRPHLQNMIDQSGLQDSIKLKGIYTPEQLERELPSYDALVLPSLRESFGIVLIEAMACGLPVLSTRCGGPEQIVTSETGFLVAPGSSEELAKGLKELDAKWSSYDSVAIRSLAESKYSIDSVVNSYFTIYKSITRN